MTKTAIKEFIARAWEYSRSKGTVEHDQILEFHVGTQTPGYLEFVNLNDVLIDDATIRFRVVSETGRFGGNVEQINMLLPLSMICALKEVLFDNEDGTKSKHFKMVAHESAGGGMWEFH